MTEEICDHVHYARMAVAVGRFSRATVTYRAVSGGPLRASREEAIADECAANHNPGADS